MHRRLNLRDAFPKSTDEYAQQMKPFLQPRRTGMDEAWEELEEGWTANNKLMGRCGLTPRTDEEGVIKLNVGGLDLSLCWHILAEAEGFKDSILFALLDGVWGKGRIPRDADGRIALDESPTCIKHILARTTPRANGRAGSVATGLPGSSTRSAVATDEVPCLIYTALVMGLPGYAPTHPKYVAMNGGSTILEAFEIAPFSAKIREWAGGSTDEMTLVYRATRDGFSTESFKARCNTDSPRTVSLIRVSSGQGNDGDSVVGSHSVVPLGDKAGGKKWVLGDMFLFMLKDCSATQQGLKTPTKWHPSQSSVDANVLVTRKNGACFGANDLAVFFDGTAEGCTLSTGRKTFNIDEDSPFLALNEKKATEIEVYRYSIPASPITTAPSTTESGGNAPTIAEADDVDSFGRSIASSLLEERVVLDRAVKEMEAAGARVSAAVGALETVYGPSVAAGEQDDIVELNVRGTRMTTLRSTLQACSRSALAAMFNEDRWPATAKDKDEHGRRLINCNPTCFSKILDVLRMRKRASWSPRLEGETQEEAEEGEGGKEDQDKEEKESSIGGSGAVLIKEADVEAFRKSVNMYFPGCESFIMGMVQSV